MMMGGHKFSISPEEYVFAAIAIYLDILNLFLYILRIMSIASDGQHVLERKGRLSVF